MIMIPVKRQQQNMVNWDKGEKLKQEVDCHSNLIIIMMIVTLMIMIMIIINDNYKLYSQMMRTEIL